MKKALITGITGQDGAYLSDFLLSKGYSVYGTVRKKQLSNVANLRYLGIEKDIECMPVNLLDQGDVTRVIDEIKPDEVYNLAAQSSVAYSFEHPKETMEFNITSTQNMLEVISNNVSSVRMYQASSCEMFGAVSSLPATEVTRIDPVSPYGMSKAACHGMVKSYRHSRKLYCASGILFNHESVLRRENFVTKKIISTAVGIAAGSGEKLSLGNIDIRRDWGYAPDYVQAMWLMLQQEDPNDYIVATNEAHSLREFVAATFSYCGLNWEEHVVFDKNLYRPADIDVMYGDPSKIREQIGWNYCHTFDELIKTLIEEEKVFQEKKRQEIVC